MSTTRKCEHCHQPIHWAARSDARFCSTRCRVAAHRAKRPATCIPAALRDCDRWVRHIAKRPVTVHGHSASSTNARTWAAYAAAAASTVGDGLGFALNGDGIVCIDLDHCIDDGALAPWAATILEACPPTYIEVSPSGHGLHVWGTADLPASFIRGGAEVYGNARYMTVTGKRYGSCPSTLGDLGAVIDAL